MIQIQDRLVREFQYNAWANLETLKSLQAAQKLPARAGAIMAHIVAADWLWLRRLGQPASNMEVWPTLSLSDCGRELDLLDNAWRGHLDELTEQGLANEIHYTNTKGERWTNTVQEVLTHVVLHASHHRGQIAMLLRDGGETPAYVDYIECVRRGYLTRPLTI